MWKEFLSLLFPDVCVACQNPLVRNEKYLCALCIAKLPLSRYHTDPHNRLGQKFWGKVPVHQSFSYLKFVKKGMVQKILHNIKYQDNADFAVMLGRWYGNDLKKAALCDSYQLIVPVPLFRLKLVQRGYNQSAMFAAGLSESTGIPHSPYVLERSLARSSQTQKSRYDRWKNVKDIYRVKDKEKVQGKHILLVDDVVTTGSTVEACVLQLLESGASRVSIAAIASAD